MLALAVTWLLTEGSLYMGVEAWWRATKTEEINMGCYQVLVSISRVLPKSTRLRISTRLRVSAGEIEKSCDGPAELNPLAFAPGVFAFSTLNVLSCRIDT